MELIYFITVRLVHVMASVCWAGGAFIFVLFVEPTAKAMGAGGMAFIQHMVVRGG